VSPKRVAAGKKKAVRPQRRVGQNAAAAGAGRDPIERLAMQVGELSMEVKYQRRFFREAKREIRKLSKQVAAQRSSLQQKERESQTQRKRLQQAERQLEKLRTSLRWRVVNVIGETRKNPVMLPKFPTLMLAAISGSKKKSLIVRAAMRVERCLSLLQAMPTAIPRHSLATATYTLKMAAYLAVRPR
jgi:dsDNA-specific endonuclease/ATPase MutS2